MSSESAKTFGFMMRPAVCSGYSSSSPTSPPAGRFCDQLEDGGRQLLRQVVDDRRRVVRRQLLQRARRSLRRTGRRAARRRPRDRARTAPPSPAGCCARPGARTRRGRSLSGSSEKTCARSAGCCFWSRLTRFAVAPNAQQALDGVEDDVQLALRHEQFRSYRELLNLTRATCYVPRATCTTSRRAKRATCGRAPMQRSVARSHVCDVARGHVRTSNVVHVSS